MGVSFRLFYRYDDSMTFTAEHFIPNAQLCKNDGDTQVFIFLFLLGVEFSGVDIAWLENENEKKWTNVRTVEGAFNTFKRF